MVDPNIEILWKETYLKAIENSVGSTQYRSFFVRYKDSGEVKDILEDGNLSCACFVTSVLFLCHMIDEPRATVKSLKKFVNESGDWTEVALADAALGDLVFYKERMYEDGEKHAHAGFVSTNGDAISTSYQARAVVRHKLDYHPIDSIWRYSWK